MRATHHEHPPYQRHHFETVDQQFDATNFAMWLFLLTEVMFFGGLFTAYLIMRNWYYPAFVEASHQLNIGWGTANTAVLILSSFTMAMGVWSAEMRRKGLLVLFLCITFVLGLAFLGIKTIEYHEKWEKHHIPGLHYSEQSFLNPASDPEVTTNIRRQAAGARHGRPHRALLLPLLRHDRHARAAHDHRHRDSRLHDLSRPAGAYTTGHVTFVENFGLYWHFVDIIWIFLFPLLYLISRYTTRGTSMRP